MIKIFDLSDGSEISVIDSHGVKLKRPTGICVGVYDDRSELPQAQY